MVDRRTGRSDSAKHGAKRSRRGFVTVQLPRHVIPKKLAGGKTAYYYNVPTKYRKLKCSVENEPLGTDFAVMTKRAAVLNGQDPLRILSGFDIGQWASPVQGAVLHLAAAAIYGVMFSVATRTILRGRPALRGHAPLATGEWVARQAHAVGQVSISRWVSGSIGLAYGLLLWLIAPSLSRGSVDALLRVVMPAHILIAHLVYGLIIGLLTSRRRAA